MTSKITLQGQVGRLTAVLNTEIQYWRRQAHDSDPDDPVEQEWRNHCNWKAEQLAEDLKHALESRTP